ncbi:MAG: hypothetical protein J07HB67_00958, partial [halophilic archaeon J07HB67]
MATKVTVSNAPTAATVAFQRVGAIS